MKKTLLLLASAALLLVGCQKEKFAEEQVGGLTEVTFTASLESGVATKAFADGDGAAANVNRCIMEIYYGGELFARQYAPVNEQKKASFTAQVVSNRTYTVAFWADKVDDASTETGRATDKYYTTNATGGLQAIAIKGDYLGNDDARDAFFHTGTYTVAQAGSSWGDIKLYRPFAQMNVITTDWDKVTTVAALKPEKVNVTLKNALVAFNAVTGDASGSQTLTYEASVYTAPAPLGSALANEKTLSMDYLFASDTKALIDINWKALHGEDANVEHSFAAVPYQRNYRTNIKGKLLTTTGQWTVEVDPIWSSPEYTHPVVIATTLEEAQAAVGPSETGAKAAGTVIVKPEAVTNRDQSKDKIKEQIVETTPSITASLPEGAKAIEFILTPQSNKDVTFELPKLPTDEGSTQFYWYIRHIEGYPTENLNIKVDSHDATRVIIDAPNKTHVVLNDVEYTHVIAITGDSTLVIPQGIKVDKLTVKKGGVEIHGTVDALEVAPETGKNVYFRACEGLSADVFKKIYSEEEPVCNYIDPWYTYEQVEGGKYNIYKRPVVAMIGEKEYKSLSDAVAAVQANETIEILSDIALDSPVTISKSDFTINGNKHIIAVSDAEFWDQYKVGGGKQGLGNVNMISVEGNNFTLKNVTLDGKDCRGVSLCTTSGGKDVLYQNITYKGRGSGHYYGEAAGLVTFDGCKFDIHGYAVHFGGESSPEDDVVIKNCEINGWSSFGDCKSLTISDSHFGGANDEGKNGWLAVLRPYCPTTVTNCTFSDIYLHEAETGYECIGLGTGAATTVTLNGCKVVNDSKQETGDAIYSIVRDNGFNEEDPNAQLQSVFAFDATGNATDGYTAGTFYAKKASNIKAAQGFKIVAVEGKDNIWTTAPVEYKTTLLRGEEVFGQYETIRDAVWAFNYDENITAGDYTLNIKPGTYNEDMILFIQDKTEGKYRTLLVQSADPTQKVVVKSTSANKAVFGISAESDYSGGPISFKNIDFDVTENTNSETCVIYFAGSQSGKPEEIFPEPQGPTLNRRYAHEVSFDNCNFVGNGKTTNVFRAPSGSSASRITIKNCNAEKIGYFVQGYFVDNTSHNWNALHIEGCIVNSQKCFINRNNNGHTEYIKDCDVTGSNDYIFRTDGGKTTIINSKFKNIATSVKDDHTGILVFRGTTSLSIDDQSTFDKGTICEYDIYCAGGAVTLNGTTEIPTGGGHNFTD